MKMQNKFYQTIGLLLVLPLLATATATAHSWLNDTAPLSVDLGTDAVVNELGSARVHTVTLNRAGSIEGRIASINAANPGSPG